MTDKTHRSAVTGQYVTAEHAAENPDTTVSESPCAECERLRGVVHTQRVALDGYREEVERLRAEPIVRTVGDLTARHIGKRVRVETDRTLPDRVRLLREIATASNEAVRLTLGVIDHPEWFLMAPFDLDTPCEVLP